jgi:hypothetical protein
MTTTTEQQKERVWPVVVALMIAVTLWLGNLWYGYRIEGDDRGLFGDMFGAVNALFSGMAFVGVIYAISMQWHEIAIAKAEIKYTKTILDKQQEQLTLQNQETKKQAFESTYFQLVRLFTEITNQIDLQKMGKSGTMVTKGKDSFPVFLDRLRKAYNPMEKTPYGGRDFDASYETFYDEHNTELGHYFRMLYNIVAFIEKSYVENKNFYAKILRAQLSDAEVAILFYNGLAKHGVKKFKPLIEKYGLLKNVNDRDIVDPKLKDRYEASAFGKSEK